MFAIEVNDFYYVLHIPVVWSVFYSFAFLSAIIVVLVVTWLIRRIT
jgi:hypothetical protein